MPRKKAAPPPPPPPPVPSGSRVLAFIAILAIAVVGFVLVWKELPSQNKGPVVVPLDTTSTGPVSPEGLTKATCEAANGHWIDCGSPCHGKNSDTCVQVCEPQCLCGGIAGWQCPANTVCTDYEPNAQTPDALGVCRKPAVVTSTAEVPPGMVCDPESHSICVSQSVKDSLLANPIMVTGTAVAFESQFSWKLEDNNGNVIEQGNIHANQPDAGIPGPFTLRQFYSSLPHTGSGILTLYEASAKDGSPTHVLALPVRLPTLTQIAQIYLPTKNGATSGQCNDVTAVEVPIIVTKLPIEATLNRLLTPLPTSETRGLTSSIPAGTRLISLSVGSGLAKAVFSQELDAGGSCRVAAIRAQIEQTLKQFSTVKRVEISVEGKSPEESLQP